MRGPHDRAKASSTQRFSHYSSSQVPKQNNYQEPNYADDLGHNNGEQSTGRDPNMTEPHGRANLSTSQRFSHYSSSQTEQLAEAIIRRPARGQQRITVKGRDGNMRGPHDRAKLYIPRDSPTGILAHGDSARKVQLRLQNHHDLDISQEDILSKYGVLLAHAWEKAYEQGYLNHGGKPMQPAQAHRERNPVESGALDTFSEPDEVDSIPDAASQGEAAVHSDLTAMITGYDTSAEAWAALAERFDRDTGNSTIYLF
ncbi:hypothetical protein A1O3_00821 [Capronia epimyces CBS 606.96]|uniref:Uncharacterized protein n=1 Tax=Capronia epimyces CBS 606.96 TaxID=1182542 RepID=W9YSM7_9EURO|nr:uncharacterized protein A1O3_00821 [Capronia epimyces CBS 606.96]EXJ92271.1 hypothetical protein A1O3_00821 [Capronia epimyces CBS 606.96]